VSRAAFALTALDVLAAVVAVALSALTITDAVLLGTMFTLPALAIGILMRSHSPLVLGAAGLGALLVALLYIAVMLLNWSGYDRRQMVLVPLFLAPAVLVALAAFGLTRTPRGHRRR
jgi:peptidoglycan/LPS O-acetylase OafA/YrhL